MTSVWAVCNGVGGETGVCYCQKGRVKGDRVDCVVNNEQFVIPDGKPRECYTRSADLWVWEMTNSWVTRINRDLAIPRQNIGGPGSH